MAGPIQLYGEIAIKDGGLATVKEMMQGAISTTKEKDPGVLSYQFYFNDDETVMYALETYRDGAAMLQHFASLGDGLEEMFSVVTMQAMHVFGEVPPEVAEALTPMGAKYFKSFGGFTR